MLQEQVRIFELLINNKKVLSEKSRRNYYGNLIEEFSNPQEMIIGIENSLKNSDDDIAQRFKEKNYKRFKVGAAYNSFYGLDLIKKSLNSIKDCVDYIVVVHQKIGCNGKPEPEINDAIIKDLLENKYIDDIVYYDTSTDSQNCILKKRNVGLDYCRKNGCDFILPLDADELYKHDELQYELNEMYDKNIKTLYSPIKSYYYDEHHCFDDTYFVPTAYRIDDRNFGICKSESGILADPVRKMDERTYKIANMYMHHYTYLKDSFLYKVDNSLAVIENNDIHSNMTKVKKHLANWKEGEDALVFMNDLTNNGNVILGLTKLKKV
jgi:hypothetical protein